jgi:hypothetical protein
MAGLTTLDELIAGMLPPRPILKVGGTMEAAGVMHSLAYTAGNPGAASAPSPGINGEALTSWAGQVPFPAAVGGAVVKLAVLSVGMASVAGALLLLDRMWQNSGLVVTMTTAQAITPVALPARDVDGTADGAGVQMALEVSAATTNGSAVATITASYTNSAGVAGRTATIPSFPATAAAGSLIPFLLAAGDTGVRSVQGVTLGTSLGAGAIHLVLYRELGDVACDASRGNYKGPLELGAPLCYGGTVPWLVWLASGTGAATVNGRVIFSQG